MVERAAPYIPQKLAERLRSQAFRVWMIASAVVFLWVLAITIAPATLSADLSRISEPLYRFFSYICHQLPDRSMHVGEHPLAVCSRCFGVYFGLFAGMLVYPLWRKVDETEPIARVWLFLSLIPIGVDWSLGVFGIWANTHFSRFITGGILGFACATFIAPALVEITRNLYLRRLSRAQAAAAE